MSGGAVMTEKKKPSPQRPESGEDARLLERIRGYGDTSGQLGKNGVKLRELFKAALDMVAKAKRVPPGILVEAMLQDEIALRGRLIFMDLSAADRALLAEFLRQVGMEPPSD